jgi:predicted ATP-grasp superfamily ATP-dependent carboligase
LRVEDHLIIVGASARAAAFSALRAGMHPWCADLFADVDLRERCAGLRLSRLDIRDLRRAVAAELAGPWMYTGGLDNRPELVARLAGCRPLWGNGPAALARARDPQFVSRALREAGLPAPAVQRDPDLLRPTCRWLVKPLRGDGGTGIRFWTRGCTVPSRGAGVYFQEYVEGESCAAVYVGDASQAWLLGLTRQLVGNSWLHGGIFRYCGSIGPLVKGLSYKPDAPARADNVMPLTTPSPPSLARRACVPGPDAATQAEDALQTSLQQVGVVLAARCGLMGLFGVDGVLRDGVFWPVEVNPRYTASVEVLEYATGLTALSWHRQAFSGAALPCPFPSQAQAAERVGKAVLFAREDLVFPAEGPWLAPTQLTALPGYADIPAAGEVIPRGRPVLTFFVRGDSSAVCEERLRQIAADLDRWLFRR